mmetsp:Transcript_8737/g.19506  ORF Transcript_8737/g.19506 Transcript_8737/m.19506 type:complete len:224 (+) Transcript_8737:825-1496(+)
MGDHDPVVHQVHQRQVPERFGEEVEQIHVILGTALACEAIDEVRLQHLMVSSVEEDRVRVSHLERKQGHDDLNGPRTSVHEVSVEEEWCGIRRQAGQAEHVQEIEVLSMEVATDSEYLTGLNKHIHNGGRNTQKVDHIQDKIVCILLGEQAPAALELQELLQPNLIDRGGSHVAWPSIARLWLWHGLYPCSLSCKVVGLPAAEPWHPCTLRCCNGGCWCSLHR